MADEVLDTTSQDSVPGTGMSSIPGIDPALSKIIGQVKSQEAGDLAARQKVADGQGEIAKQRFAAQQQSAAEIAKTRGQAPAVPDTQAPPQAPKLDLDPQETKQALALVTMLGVFGGSRSRAPATAALNNFTAGMTGYIQGKENAFKTKMTEYDANVKQVAAVNKEVWSKYQAALDKNKNDVQAQIEAMKLVAAEYDLQADLKMLDLGQVTEVIKSHERINNVVLRSVEHATTAKETATIHAQQVAATRDATAAQREATNAATQERLGMERERLDNQKSQNYQKLVKDYDKASSDMYAKYLNEFNKQTDPESDRASRLTQQYNDRYSKLLSSYKALGVVEQGSQPAAPAAPSAPAAPAAQTPPTAPASGAVPSRPDSVPPGSQYHPQRKMWRSPDGKLYNESGAPVAASPAST